MYTVKLKPGIIGVEMHMPGFDRIFEPGQEYSLDENGKRLIEMFGEDKFEISIPAATQPAENPPKSPLSRGTKGDVVQAAKRPAIALVQPASREMEN
jgi:hypothetical protein